MFSELNEKMRRYILEHSDLAFRPDVKFKTAVISGFIKHRVILKNDAGKKEDVLGTMFLATSPLESYELARLEASVNIPTALRLFMYELILKKAIENASKMGCPEVVISCEDPLIADAFLNCRFSVTLTHSNATNNEIYCGSRTLN